MSNVDVCIRWVYSDHKLVRVSVNMDKVNHKLTGYFNFNTYLFEVAGGD